ncbi:hypothetical protein JKF63_04240 [Porcisia hertigi]|uniref:Uncharacterized protein n=1 Tax=Porcisia hertigi TaxID=2761500 RepID=A0A836I2Z5_9TRYP|nr:hypothetical protein JKF63_04240 [Porcisia hertigi]
MDNMCGGDDKCSEVYCKPLEWRSVPPLTARSSLLKPATPKGCHVGTPFSALHHRKSRSDVDEQLGCPPAGAFTPRIRYRTSTSASYGSCTAASIPSISPTSASFNCNGESRYRGESPGRHVHGGWTTQADLFSAHPVASPPGSSAPMRSSSLHPHSHARETSFLSQSPSLRVTTRQGGTAAVSIRSTPGGSARRTPRPVTSRARSETTARELRDAEKWSHRHLSSSMSRASSSAALATSHVSDRWAQGQQRSQGMRGGYGEAAEQAEASPREACSRSHVPVRHAEAEADDPTNYMAESTSLGHPTLRSLTDEYNCVSAEGTVDWVGLQVHLRRHTHFSHIFTLDLTRYHMRHDQWLWFTQEILPQLNALEVLRLVQMQLEDEWVAELVRGSCGLSAAADGRRTASRATQRSPSPVICHQGGGGGGGVRGSDVYSASLTNLRVLDLSGNAVTQRSCTHLGKMMLWMAATLEELRLLGNPLKDYGMQTLAVYVAKLNLEAVEQDPLLFPVALREICGRVYQRSRPERVKGGGGMATPASPSPQSTAAAGVVRAGDDEDKGGDDTRKLLLNLPLGLVLLDLRDCRASVRGLSDMLAAASRAHRLRTVVLSHNVAGVTSLLPLPANAYRESVHLTEEEAMSFWEGEALARGSDDRDSLRRRRPLACRLRLVKTPLICSGALMRRQQTAFSDVAGFSTSCALSTLVFHGVPLSQTCSPLGVRELLLNIFFSCPLLDLVDLSDTFESSLVPPDALQALFMEANRRDTADCRSHSAGGQHRLHINCENRGELELMLDSTTVSNQTRLGDIFGELMAHAAYNAVVRRRLAPSAFLHVRELHLSNTGLTDAGVRGLCMSVCRGRTSTGMLASLTVLNLSDNLLSVRGCMRVISAFLLADDDDDDAEANTAQSGPERLLGTSTTDRSVRIANMTALALQRNTGREIAGNGGPVGSACSGRDYEVDDGVHLRQLCTLAEAAALRRAGLRSASCSNQAHRGSGSGGEIHHAASEEKKVPALTVYFSANPRSATPRPTRSSGFGSQRQSSSSLSPAASLEVFYAGCDERGDVYCTCPCSRFFSPKPLSAQKVQGGDTNGEGLSHSSQRRLSPKAFSPTFSAAAITDDYRAAAALIASNANRGDSAALENGATQITGATPQHCAQRSPPRDLLVSLDARCDIGSANARTDGENPGGLADTTPLHSPWMFKRNGYRVAASSRLSSPSPLLISSMAVVAVPQCTSDLTTSGVDAGPVHSQQHQPLVMPPPRESNLSVRGEAPVGTLSMGKDNEALSLDSGPPSGVGHADADAVLPVAVDAVASRPLSAKRSGGRRARLRGARTFVLSYDHPAGHLLCRALGALLRPSPDPLGEGARAALNEDLLVALRQAVTASTSGACSEKGDDIRGGGGGGEGGSSGGQTEVESPITVVETVRYLTPGLPSATLAAGGDPSQQKGENHWMRFEVTANGRRKTMARALEAVLNVPLSEQRVCFQRLLHFLDQHVRCEEGEDEDRAAEDIWDPVRAIDRAVRSSAAVRERLEIAYGGVSVNAVHACHQYHGVKDTEGLSNSGTTSDSALAPAGALEGMGDTEGVVRLDQLYSALWGELGIPVKATLRDALPHALDSVRSKEGVDRTPTGKNRWPNSLGRAAGDSDLCTSLFLPHNTVSREALGVTVSPPVMAQQQDPQVVNLHDGVGSESKPTHEEGLQASLHRTPRPGVFAFTAATGSDRDDTGWAASWREEVGMEDGGGETSVDSTRVATPEQQLSHAHRIELGVAAATSSPPRFDPGYSNGGAPQQGPLAVHVVLTDPLVGLSSPRKTHDVAAAAVTPTISQMQQQQQQQQRVSPVSLTEAPTHHLDNELPCVDDGCAGNNVPQAAGHSGNFVDEQRGEGGGSRSGGHGGSLGSGDTSFSEPQQDQSEERPQIQPELAPAGPIDVKAAGAKGEEDMAIGSPIRVQRLPSNLVGRVKTFTLSYLHQDGTAVCRAWRLLHTATQAHRHSGVYPDSSSSETSVDVTTPISLSAPSSLAALAKESRECLCDDFLAFLQPPDEDTAHAVLSVSVHCDSGVATAMLQVQVQTNERRATLADRLQHSAQGVRRSVEPDGRISLVSLSVEEVDQYYFPRLTRLLRRHGTVADTVTQVQAFLQPREVLQARLLNSYGSVAALVHYYHGSPTSLENELGISSWQVLVESTPLSAARDDQLTENAMSPPVAVDRVPRCWRPLPEASDAGGGAHLDISALSGNGDTADTGEHASRTPSPHRPNATPGSPEQSTMAGAPRPPSRVLVGSGVARTTKMQGRPPPRPRCPPTPPHAITHTSSISFDEVTEVPTSEAGPVVVLRGTTPTPTLRSPSNPQSFKPTHFSVLHPQALATSPPSGSLVEERLDHSAPGEPGGYSAAGFTTGLVSPLTVLSSGSRSPTPQPLSLCLGHPGVTAPAAAAGAPENSLSASPVLRLSLHPAQHQDAVPAPALKSEEDGGQNNHSDTSANPSALAVSVVSPSLVRMPMSTTKETDGSTVVDVPAARLQRPAVGADHSSDDYDRQSSSRPPQLHPGLPSTAAGAGGLSLDPGLARDKSEYERVLEGKYKRLMRVAYDGVARGSVPLDPQHQQRTVIGRGHWGTQKVELSLEWEILFVLTFEKSRKLGRSSRRAQMLVHPVGCGFECAAGDDVVNAASSTTSLHSSVMNSEAGDGGHHPLTMPISRILRKKELSKTKASHLVITIRRPFEPAEVGSSSHDIEETLMAGALLTMSSSKTARLLGGGGENISNTSRASTSVNQAAQEYVFKLCQASLVLDIEMKSSKHVQEALRLLKNGIRRATQAVKKSMQNMQIRPPAQTLSPAAAAAATSHQGPPR